MKTFLKSVCCLILFASIIGVNKVDAQDDDFKIWQKDFEKQALAEGISQKTLNKFFFSKQNVRRDPKWNTVTNSNDK